MASARLPGKVMLPAAGKRMLEHHLTRLAWAKVPVYVATTTSDADDIVAEVAAASGVDCFRGSETDVLGRYAEAARAFSLDVVVRVTSDCPLVDGNLVGRGIDLFCELGDPCAFVSNVVERTYPRGFDFEVFSAVRLLEADRRATARSDREHVTPFLHRSSETLQHSVLRSTDASRFRVTLDTEPDLEVIRSLIEIFGAAELTAEEIISLLEAHPEVASINSHVEQKKLGD